MAFGAVKSLVVSGASSLFRLSGAPRRTGTSSCEFSTHLIRSTARGTRASSVTCADCALGKQWSFRGLGFRFYATQKLSSIGAKKSFAQGRTRRGGGAAAAAVIRGTPRSGSIVAAGAGAVKEDGELEEQEEEWKSRNQSKREAKRARQWGVELASLAPAQLKQAVRWAGLSEEVYDAVMIVKNLGTISKVRNGRRRQYTYIGGLLRNVDPNVMEPVLKATRDGDVESIMLSSPVLPDPADLDDKESWAEEEEDDEDAAKIMAEDWLHGLINGVSSLEDEVYSIYDVDFDRQELRKLVTSVQKSTVVAESSGTSEPTQVDGGDAVLSSKESKSQEKLRQFLINIARQRTENQSYLS